MSAQRERGESRPCRRTRARDGKAMQGPEFMQEAEAAAARKMAAANFGSRQLSARMARKDKENAPQQNKEVEQSEEVVVTAVETC